MRRASITQHLIFLMIIMVTSIFCVGLLVVVPSIQKTRELKKNVEQTQATLEQDYQKIIQLRRSVQELDAIYEKMQSYSLAMIKPGDELLVITELESLASRHAIEQTLHVGFTDPAAIPAAERKTLPTKLHIPYYTFSFLNHGTFEQQMAFIEALEHLPYYLIIDAMVVEQRGGGGDRVTLRFDARVYASTE